MIGSRLCHQQGAPKHLLTKGNGSSLFSLFIAFMSIVDKCHQLCIPTSFKFSWIKIASSKNFFTILRLSSELGSWSMIGWFLSIWFYFCCQFFSFHRCQEISLRRCDQWRSRRWRCARRWRRCRKWRRWRQEIVARVHQPGSHHQQGVGTNPSQVLGLHEGHHDQ